MTIAWKISTAAQAVADVRMDTSTTHKLWNSFTLSRSRLDIQAGENHTFSMGEPPPELPEGKEFALVVTEKGAAVRGRDFGGLMRGFFALLMRMEYADGAVLVKPVQMESQYRMANRMIHLCVFPESELKFIRKMIRLAALCQYTHVVLEFWGMLKYDCLKELSWPHALTKAEAGEMIGEIRELGMEPIPMFNQLGHATASRVKFGKHVVLDQNPALQELFTPDGWAWNIHSEKVEQLLSQVRGELYELFGPGEYMHIGCDEAYYYTRCDEERAAMPAFLNHLTTRVAAEGRRPMVWMDMMLERGKHPGYTATCKPEDVEKLIRSLHPSSVMVDWQYDINQPPVETLLDLKPWSYDVMGAPWLHKENAAAHADTIEKNDLFGIMLTTWHVLKEQAPGILNCAKMLGAAGFPWSAFSGPREETATLLRRVSFEGNTYEECGWSRYQIKT